MSSSSSKIWILVPDWSTQHKWSKFLVTWHVRSPHWTFVYWKPEEEFKCEFKNNFAPLCLMSTTWCYFRLSVKHELKGNEHRFNFCLLNCPFYAPLVNYLKKLRLFVFFFLRPLRVVHKLRFDEKKIKKQD